ncbi:hypothetical protein [Roseicella sp. DB1501]|uniref:hypothetical protein n=1 Tax=Roseicella sp. DB1501 TaxID=2730925 RepID=UPI0014924396|nr:hypothetical protein [Roseicella sp. DB1501]
MAQDDDFARMAAALGVPGLRYRSFRNAPVRPGRALAPPEPASDLPAAPPLPVEPAWPGRPVAAVAPLPVPMPIVASPAAAPAAWPLLEPLFAPPVAETVAVGTLARLRAAPAAGERRPASAVGLPDPLFAPRPARGAGFR